MSRILGSGTQKPPGQPMRGVGWFYRRGDSFHPARIGLVEARASVARTPGQRPALGAFAGRVLSVFFKRPGRHPSGQPPSRELPGGGSAKKRDYRFRRASADDRSGSLHFRLARRIFFFRDCVHATPTPLAGKSWVSKKPARHRFADYSDNVPRAASVLLNKARAAKVGRKTRSSQNMPDNASPSAASLAVEKTNPDLRRGGRGKCCLT